MTRPVNKTELLAMVRELEPEAHAGMTFEELEAALQPGTELPVRTVNKTRLQIMEFITEHWLQVRPVVSCPAKSLEPDACFQCTDIQVVECALSNKQTIYKKD